MGKTDGDMDIHVCAVCGSINQQFYHQIPDSVYLSVAKAAMAKKWNK